jgi:hypothetical protein
MGQQHLQQTDRQAGPLDSKARLDEPDGYANPGNRHNRPPRRVFAHDEWAARLKLALLGSDAWAGPLAVELHFTGSHQARVVIRLAILAADRPQKQRAGHILAFSLSAVSGLRACSRDNWDQWSAPAGSRGWALVACSCVGLGTRGKRAGAKWNAYPFPSAESARRRG